VKGYNKAIHPYLGRPKKPRVKFKSHIRPNFYYNSALDLHAAEGDYIRNQQKIALEKHTGKHSGPLTYL